MALSKESLEMIDLLAANEPSGPHRSFSYTYIASLSSLGIADVRRIADDLVSKDLAKFVYGTTKTGQRLFLGIALKQDGYRYKEIQGLERKEKWKERIYCFVSGVLVAVIGEVILRILLG